MAWKSVNYYKENLMRAQFELDNHRKTKPPSTASSTVKRSYKKRKDQLIQKALRLRHSMHYTDQGCILIATGIFMAQCTDNPDMRVEQTFTIHFHDIQIIDVKALVKIKLPTVKPETIKIQMIELGQINL